MNTIAAVKPLNKNTRNLIVMGRERENSPPFAIFIVDNQGTGRGFVQETVERNLDGRPKWRDAEFLSYNQACEHAKALLKDLKLTVEEDKQRAELFPNKTFSLEDV